VPGNLSTTTVSSAAPQDRLVGAPASNPGRGAPGAPQPEHDGGDLFDYALLRDYAGFVLRAPGRHRALAAGSFLTIVAFTSLALWALPKSYRVETRILAQRNQIMSVLSNPNLVRPSESDAPTRAARETVLRWDNLVSLIEQTDLVDRYLRTRAPASRARDAVVQFLTRKEMSREALVETLAYTLEKHMFVDVNEGTVTITVDWFDADAAYHLTEAAQQSFLETRHATEIAILGEAIGVLGTHANSVLRDVEATIQEIEEKERSRHMKAAVQHPPAVRVAATRPAPDPELSRLQSNLETKRRALADLEEYRHKRLADLQAQLAQQQAIYAEHHPNVLAVRESIEALSRPSPQIEALRGEVQQLEREQVRRGGYAPRPTEMVAEPLPQLRADATPPEDLSLDYARGKLRLLYNKYGMLVDRMDGARVEMDTARAAFKYRYSVISPPQMPKRPTKPNAVLLVARGALGGILFAFFAATVADLRSGRIVERWQIERTLGLPLLTTLRR